MTTEAQNAYMAYLQQEPELYHLITKKKLAMELVKFLAEEGELLFEDILIKKDVDEKEAEKVLNELADLKILGRERFYESWLFWLDKKGERLLELYKKARKEL
jgi:predicted transcriptional regulator